MSQTDSQSNSSIPNGADHEATQTAAKSGNLEFMYSRNFLQWLEETQVSLAFTTYHANRLFFIGRSTLNGKLDLNAQTFPRIMGMWASEDAQTLYVSHLFQLLRFEALQTPEAQKKGFDRIYVPRFAFTTGDSDIHDVAADSEMRPYFVNTLYSCVCTISQKYSFTPVWKPPFISKLVPEDRCHLNGLAMHENKPRYVTCVSNSDVSDGWREHRSSGGMVIDISNNEVLASGLSMPHSPRMYQGKLWVHNSGKGEFGYVDLEKGGFVPIAFCPGYLRGLTFVDHYAVVGMSLSRHNVNFANLPLEHELAKRNAQPRCGIQVIDLNTGDVLHGIRLGGAVQELFDVAVLRGVKNASAVGFGKADLPRLLNPPPLG